MNLRNKMSGIFPRPENTASSPRRHMFAWVGMLILLLIFLTLIALFFLRAPVPTQGLIFIYQEGAVSSLVRIDADGGSWETLARSGNGDLFGDTLEKVTGLQNRPPSTRQSLGFYLAPEWLGDAGLLAFREYDPGHRCEKVGTLSPDEPEAVEVLCLDGDIRNEAFGWSPDGRFFVFVERDSGAKRIRLMDAAGRVVNSRSLAGSVWGLSWSPDSKRLAVTLENERSLLIISLDGSDVLVAPEGAAFGKPTWSPNGERLAFLCYFQERIDFCFSDADGGHFNRIEFPPEVPYIKHSPIWSPQGDLLVFEAVQNGTFNELYLVSPDGTQLRRLTFHPLGDSEPAWSPDGGQIAFVSMRDGNREIYRINTDGSGLERLTETPGNETSPVWIGGD